MTLKGRVTKMSPQTLIFPLSSPKTCWILGRGHILLYLYRIQWTLQESRKPSENNSLGHTEKGDYKPAYKKSQKTAPDQLQDMPAELAQIVTVWHDLPTHIKAAMTTLAQTVTQGDVR